MQFRNSKSDVTYIPVVLITLASASFGNGVEYNIGGESGKIATPNVAGTYPDNLNITWHISVKPGFRVSLYFTEFDLEDSFDEDRGGSCVYDYLKIEENGKLLHKFCGNPILYPVDAPTILREFKSSDRHMTLRFVSDYSNEQPIPKGFKAHYKQIDRDECQEMEIEAATTLEDWDLLVHCNHHCHNVPASYYCSCNPGFILHENKHTCTRECAGKVLTTSMGAITTSRYPEPYSKLARCDWTIKSGSEGIHIELRFVEKFEIEKHFEEGCVYDWVEYEDANGVFSERYCGKSRPAGGKWISTNSHTVKVMFHSDLSVESEGFKLLYRTKRVHCERILVAPENGKITSTLETFVFEDVVNFECNVGHRMVGDSSLTCLSNGDWSSSEPVCEIVKCKHPIHLDAVKNGKIKEKEFQLTYGSSVTVLCYVWYEMTSGTSVWKCGEDGAWHEASDPVALNENNNIPECDPICGLKGSTSILSGSYRFGDVLAIEEDKEDFVAAQIIAGKESKEAEWPWMAFINLFGPGVDAYLDFCGGSLISPNTVITAAHCTARTYKKQIRVYIGLNNRLEVKKEELQEFSVIELYEHPGFNNKTEYANDIAILKLNGSVRIGKYARPICLPRSEREKTLPEKALSGDDNFQSSGYITGWGVTELGHTSYTLMEARVPPIEHKKCKKHADISKEYNIAITDNMLCGGFIEGGKDSCSGDSGGPYTFKDKARAKWFLNGIVSFGSSERDCGDKTFGIYVNVAKYIAWIESFIQD